MNFLCTLLTAAFLFAASSAAPAYARLNRDTVLFAITERGYQPLCTLPATYFVGYSESPSGEYVRVGYQDLTGYVRTDEITPVEYEPKYKYAFRTLTPDNDGLPVNLRRAPHHVDSPVLAEVPADSRLTLYGTTEGSALNPLLGSLWYYVKYTDGAQSLYGYVYAGHAKAEPLKPNSTEKADAIRSPVASAVDEPFELSPTLQGVLIAVLCIPAALIMLLLFKNRSLDEPTKRVPRNRG